MTSVVIQEDHFNNSLDILCNKSVGYQTIAIVFMGFPDGSVVKKKLPANAGDSRDVGLIPGSGRYPGGGNGNILAWEIHGQKGLVGYSPQLQKSWTLFSN